ncbi:unnamed protein product, partial [Cyprideis torosa]
MEGTIVNPVMDMRKPDLENLKSTSRSQKSFGSTRRRHGSPEYTGDRTGHSKCIVIVFLLCTPAEWWEWGPAKQGLGPTQLIATPLAPPSRIANSQKLNSCRAADSAVISAAPPDFCRTFRIYVAATLASGYCRMGDSKGTINSRMCMRYLAFLGQSCRITFIGDSLKRNLFFELANHIHTEDLTETAKHANLSVTDKDIRLTMEFIWHPYINESTTRLLEQIKASESRPSMVVMGSVMWALLLNKTQEQKLEEHRRSLTEVAKVMSLI